MNFYTTDLLSCVHPEWYPLVTESLNDVDSAYLLQLQDTPECLPNIGKMLSAFSVPLSTTQYLLFGESPYPRKISANGYAFWDAAVGCLWSTRGFSREINRATSLRNLMKMLLYARGDLVDDFSQNAIARLDHSIYYQTAQELFNHVMQQGFLLLNASLVYQPKKIPYHAKMWRPFVSALLNKLFEEKPTIQLLLFGKIAELVPNHQRFSCLIAEHPYNLSFITNPQVINFFKPLDILYHHERKFFN